MKQTVYEHRVNVLADLVKVVDGDATRFLADTYNLEIRVQNANYSTPKDRQDIVDKMLQFQEDYISLVGKINTNISIVNSIFHTGIRTIDLSVTKAASDDLPLHPTDAHNDQRDTVAALAQARKAVFQNLIVPLQAEINKLQVYWAND